MNTINAALGQLTDLLLAPFTSLPLVALIFWSAVAGVAMTYVFGKTSNQAAIRRVADRARAQLLGIRLFKDDLGVTLQCQVELLKASGLRMLYSLPPMLVLLVPFVIVLTQLATRYECRPLFPGETTVVELHLSPEGWTKYRNVELKAPEGVVVETEALRDQGSRTLYWRVRPQTGESTTLSWQLGDTMIEKSLAVAESTQALEKVDVRRPGPGLIDRLLYPGEPGFAKSAPVESIDIEYAPRQTLVFGVDIPWWATFFIVSMLVAILVRRFMNVEF